MGIEERFALQGVKILVVDDDPDSCELLEMVLQVYEEAEVRVFLCVNDALADFSQFQPQVLISDIAMPHEDGTTLIRAVRSLPVEQGGKIPAIALSAMAREEDRQIALEAGFDRYLVKPMIFEELLSTLRDLLEETIEVSRSSV
ncbi:MAG: response regulator [Plectolyngbya sp. WJT66-NPBG17]|jgi:CheY-like chemotaxis protein|nr:response regulator [Plectolyngbya sp. WJT66-NPBG17]